MEMERKRIEQTFCWKISGELKVFQYRMMQQTKEEIYARAYEIDCMVRIYEILLEQSQKLETEQLEKAVRVSSLLAFLYSEWLKIPDMQNEELERTLCSLLEEWKKKGGEKQNEKTGIDIKVG